MTDTLNALREKIADAIGSFTGWEESAEQLADKIMAIISQHEKGASAFLAPLATGECAELNKARSEAPDNARRQEAAVTGMGCKSPLPASDTLNRCPVCNGNDASAPCAYPEGGMKGCLRDKRLATQVTIQESL